MSECRWILAVRIARSSRCQAAEQPCECLLVTANWQDASVRILLPCTRPERNDSGTTVRGDKLEYTVRQRRCGWGSCSCLNRADWAHTKPPAGRQGLFRGTRRRVKDPSMFLAKVLAFLVQVAMVSRDALQCISDPLDSIEVPVEGCAGSSFK